MTDSIAAQLKQASNGLLFLSETDAPFEVIHWPAQAELEYRLSTSKSAIAARLANVYTPTATVAGARL